tara:strand:- start:198 stop:587 length:390 start_codon:yes stop_codon:yes gene_type:complete
MPEVEVEIGGRRFTVACQSGEESYLMNAASVLDFEASAIGEQVGRLSESRMLLMAGLMLADKTGSFKDKVSKSENEFSAAMEEISKLKAELAASAITGRESENMSADLTKTLEDIAQKTEELADRVNTV